MPEWEFGVYHVLGCPGKGKVSVKIKIRPIAQKGASVPGVKSSWEAGIALGTIGKEELVQVLARHLREDFKQMQMLTTKENISVLAGKKEISQ